MGAFPLGVEELLISNTHPVREVPAEREERFNQRKLRSLYPEHRKGPQLRVILGNDWELAGTIENAGQFYVALRLNETKVIHLHRHALADFEWVGGEPPPVPEWAVKQSARRLSRLSQQKPKKKSTEPKSPNKPPELPNSLVVGAVIAPEYPQLLLLDFVF